MKNNLKIKKIGKIHKINKNSRKVKFFFPEDKDTYLIIHNRNKKFLKSEREIHFNSKLKFH